MEDIWMKTFDKLFGSLPDNWRLVKGDSETLENIKKVAHLGWKKYQDKAKVKFKCSKCKNRWTSTKGTVIFHYRFERMQRRGQVKMCLPGQKCRRCNGSFESAVWYKEEIEKVLGNLLVKVKGKFYNDGNQPNSSINTSQRRANMRSDHKSKLCQACEQGVCTLTLDVRS